MHIIGRPRPSEAKQAVHPHWRPVDLLRAAGGHCEGTCAGWPRAAACPRWQGRDGQGGDGRGLWDPLRSHRAPRPPRPRPARSEKLLAVAWRVSRGAGLGRGHHHHYHHRADGLLLKIIYSADGGREGRRVEVAMCAKWTGGHSAGPAAGGMETEWQIQRGKGRSCRQGRRQFQVRGVANRGRDANRGNVGHPPAPRNSGPATHQCAAHFGLSAIRAPRVPSRQGRPAAFWGGRGTRTRTPGRAVLLVKAHLLGITNVPSAFK